MGFSDDVRLSTNGKDIQDIGEKRKEKQAMLLEHLKEVEKDWRSIQMQAFDLLTLCFLSKLALSFQLSKKEQPFDFVM